jgi:hypothetical protein
MTFAVATGASGPLELHQGDAMLSSCQKATWSGGQRTS